MQAILELNQGVVTAVLPNAACSGLTLNIYDQSLNLRVGRTAAEMEEIWDSVFVCCKHHRLCPAISIMGTCIPTHGVDEQVQCIQLEGSVPQ